MTERPFSDHFASDSTGYAAFRPSYPASLFKALANAAPTRTSAWDCGAGTGQASVALVEWLDEVLATDASANQIAHALAHPRVTYGVARAEESGLPDASVSLITVAQALHWFDVDAFHAEATRVLVKNGVIAEWTYGLMIVRSAPAVTRFVQDFDVAMHPYWPPERRFVDRHYQDFAFPFSPIALGDFAMHAEWTVEQLLGYLRTWSAVARCRVHSGSDPIEPLVDALRTAWGSERIRELQWPLTLRVGTK